MKNKNVAWYEVRYTKDGVSYQDFIRGKQEAMRAVKNYNGQIVNITYRD